MRVSASRLPQTLSSTIRRELTLMVDEGGMCYSCGNELGGDQLVEFDAHKADPNGRFAVTSRHTHCRPRSMRPPVHGTWRAFTGGLPFANTVLPMFFLSPSSDHVTVKAKQRSLLDEYRAIGLTDVTALREDSESVGTIMLNDNRATISLAGRTHVITVSDDVRDMITDRAGMCAVVSFVHDASRVNEPDGLRTMMTGNSVIGWLELTAS